MKTWWRGDIAPSFLTSALDVDELSVLRPGRFTPREMPRTTHWIGIWVRPRPGLDAVEKNLPEVTEERHETRN
jgi:hypothetical protein